MKVDRQKFKQYHKMRQRLRTLQILEATAATSPGVIILMVNQLHRELFYSTEATGPGTMEVAHPTGNIPVHKRDEMWKGGVKV